MDNAELIRRFKGIGLDKKQTDRVQTLRADALRMADHINMFAKDGREKSLALSALEESIMWATRAIAVNPEA